MILKDFLKKAVENKLRLLPLYVFIGKSYSPLVAYYLIEGIKKNEHVVRYIYDDEFLFSEFESSASTTFLGQSHILFLGDCSEYSVTLKKKLIAFLDSYQGPHTIIAFFNEKDYTPSEDCAVMYNESLDYATLSLFLEYTCNKKVPQLTYDMQKNSLQEMLSLYFYTFFTNDFQSLVKAGWINKIVNQDVSLFELSKLFFAKKRDPFFVLWNKIKDEFAPVFWTSFWSEQLWNAFWVIHFRNKQEFNTAKTFQYKLPFSFLQYDWQKSTLHELKKAHSLITQVDLRLKLSANPDNIELMYYTFFSK